MLVRLSLLQLAAGTRCVPALRRRSLLTVLELLAAGFRAGWIDPQRAETMRAVWGMLSRAQHDARLILANRMTRPHLDQLLRAVGAISADLDEGYSRSSGPERAHYYEYGCGSARESRSWYFKCATAFHPDLLTARLALYSRIVRILTAIIPRERTRKVEKRRGTEPDR